MRIAFLRLLAVTIGIAGASGCAGYTSALGFRARRAAIERDVPAFLVLMEEAAKSTPAGPLDNPKKTVLTHFLDLADDPRFLEVLDAWRERGFVGDEMTCSIHRARYSATTARDPSAADASARTCIDRARSAASEAGRAWEIEECLEEAPFLVNTSTAALSAFLRMSVDPTEPVRFRHALIDAMTRVYITSADRLAGNRPELGRAEAMRIARDTARKQADRIEWIVRTVRPHIEAPLLAAATTRGVLEVENVEVPLGLSYVGRHALSEDPYDHDLAWGWVRAMKAKKKIPRIAGLGLWDRDREPAEDVFWYVCVRPDDRDGTAQSSILGPLRAVDGISLRARAPLRDREDARRAHCVDEKRGSPYPRILGPFPLEATARASAAEMLASERPGIETTVLLRARIDL